MSKSLIIDNYLTGIRMRQRLPTQEAVEKEILAWETERNKEAIKVEWQFGTMAARLKLKRHYPELK